ncbi:hypothetical protein A6P54_13470 [Bacillus sp. MKU004]|nr:hypothetical protein A6P54_13470 [Bacillus sp. MKU004]
MISLFIILTIGFIIYGYLHWKDRTSISAFNNGTDTDIPEISATNESDAVNKEVKQEESSSNMEELTSEWPDEAQESFLKAVSENRPYKMAVIGSGVLGAGDSGWSDQLKEALQETYGGQLEVEVFEYDMVSIDFLYSAESDEIIEYAPDLVLYEPFTLNDNSGRVASRDNHRSIELFLDQLKQANSDVVLMLQPTQPLYGATFYPQQVESLKEFAAESDIPYLDHWALWPDSGDEELLDYVDESKTVPNEKGHEMWADYLIDYFIHNP